MRFTFLNGALTAYAFLCVGCLAVPVKRIKHLAVPPFLYNNEILILSNRREINQPNKEISSRIHNLIIITMVAICVHRSRKHMAPTEKNGGRCDIDA